MEQSLVATQIVTAIVTAGIQVITLVVVIIYTRYTAKMTSAAKASAEAANRTIDEMKEAREQENAPYVVVYFDVPPNEFVIHLVIKNVGKSIATDVKMKFTPPLSSVVFSGINDVPLIKDGISSLPPQYEIRTFFDGIIQHFGNPNLPLSSTVEVSFSGGLGNKRRTSEQILDLSMFYGLLSSRKKGMDDLVKAVEEIEKNLDKISDHLEEVSKGLASGISIKNPTITTSELNLQPDSW